MNWIKTNSVFVILLFLGVIAVFFFKDYSIHDFGNYYFGAYFLGQGGVNSELYFPHIFNQNIAQLGYPDLYLSYAPNTPFLSVFFYPFTFLPAYSAKIVFNTLSVLLFSYSINKWFVRIKIKPQYLILILLIGAIPITNGLLFGQVYLLLFFLLSEGYFALKNGNNIKVALFWSIVICLKVFPIFLLLFLILNRKFRPFIYSIVGVFILFLFSLIFVDFEVWKFYLMEALPKALSGEIYAEFVPHYQSVDELLKHYFVFHPNYNPYPIYDSYPLYKGILLGFKSLLMMVGVLLAIQKKELLIQFCYWIFAAMLFSSYGSSYSMILVLFMAILLLQYNKVFKVRSVVFFILLFLMSNLPVSLFIGFNFPFIKTLFYLSILFLLFFREITFNKLRYLLGLSILVSIIIFAKQEKLIPEDYFTSENQPGLIYDYDVNESELSAKYWSVEGEKEFVFKEAISSQSIDNIELIDNQIYYHGKQMTFINSNKLKPVCINRNTIVYLSDQGRGLGFYTVRELKIPLK